MPIPALSVTLDTAQQRVQRDRIGVSVAGLQFNTGQFFSNVILEPLTNTVMLQPNCLNPSWYTSNAAPYDKLALSDFGSPSGWTTTDITGVGGSKYLSGPTTPAGISLITSSVIGHKNRGMYVAQYGYSEGSNVKLMDMGYASSAGVANGPSIRVYAGGQCEVWYGGVIIAVGNVSGAADGAKLANQLIELMIIPCRHRELLVISTAGNGVRAILPDILETDTDPTITPNSKFWVTIYGTPKIQIAKIKYPDSGWVASLPCLLPEAPETGAVREIWNNVSWAGGTGDSYKIYGDPSYMGTSGEAATASLKKLDGTTAFVANSSDKACRFRLDLTAGTAGGASISTPFIYGGQAGWTPKVADTDGSESASLDAYWQHASFEVPEMGGAAWTFQVIGGDSSDVVEYYNQSDKPTEILFGDTTVMQMGISEPVTGEIIAYDDAAISTLVLQPYLVQTLKDYQFRERIIFDGDLISDSDPAALCALRRIANDAGIDDAFLDLESATVTAGDIAPASCGEFSEIAQIGDNAWDVFTRLVNDYLGGWCLTERPTSSGYKLSLKSPATLNAAASKFTLYATREDAIAALILGGMSADDAKEAAWRYVWRVQKTQRLRAECNEVFVMGYDRRFQWPIMSLKRDTASSNPTTPPSSRPTNWIGKPKRLGVANRGISSQLAADAGCALLYDRGTPARDIRPVTCELMYDEDEVPLWVGDKLTLDGYGDFLISSIAGEVTKNPDPDNSDDRCWRECTYTVSNRVGYSSNAAHFDDVKTLGTLNQSRGAIVRRGFGDLLTLRVGNRNIL